MLTSAGQTRINQYLAGMVPSLAQSIAIGVGSSAATANDTRLDFEVTRIGIEITSYDPSTGELVFRAPFPTDFTGTIYEIGLLSSPAELLTPNSSRILTLFDVNDEAWINLATGEEADVTLTGKISEESVSWTGNPGTVELSGIALDLADSGPTDEFSLAFVVTSGSVSNVVVQFMTDETNYYSVTFTGTYAGDGSYRIASATKASAVATGSPSWDQITALRLTGTTSTLTEVSFDALRLENNTFIDTDDVLVGRTVIPAGYFTGFDGVDAKNPEDIEYTLVVQAAGA